MMSTTETTERILAEARFIVDNNTTIRVAAKYFPVSKTTLHIDVTKRLRNIDILLYNDVQKVIQKNREERHLRGGEATRKKSCNK